MVEAKAPAPESRTTPVKSLVRSAIERLQDGIDADIERIIEARRPIGHLSWEPTDKELSDMIVSLRTAGDNLANRALRVQQQWTEEHQKEAGIE
ncbi:MAG: hypothetical protein ACHQX1_00405 [Candidatus Micrarchaeales archaeon]